MRVLIVGAGATGGYFGARLIEAGRDVTFLLRERRAAQIRERGIEISSPLGDLSVHPRMTTAPELRAHPEPFDLVVIGVKSYQLAQAIEDFSPAVGPRTLLLPILNGMKQLAELDERFGADRVLGGSVRIVADLDEAGRIHHKTKLSEWSYGERSGERSDRIQAVDAALRGAGFDAMLQPDILATLWQKWWILASLGSICILGRGSIGQVADVAHGPQMARALVQECIHIARENGYPPDEGMLADHLKRMTERGSALTSSLYRDMLKGAPVEADHILGDLLEHAQNVPVPLLNAAYVQLKVYEAARRR